MIECFSSRSKAGCKRKRLRWRVTIEDHSSDFSNAAINFKKANISDIVSPNKYSLNTEGGQEILLNGSDFGSLNETLISAIYNNDLTNVSYTASGCVVTKSDIQIQCYTVPGMGKNYSWTLKIVDQEGVPSLDSVSYSPPIISGVSILGDGNLSSLPTNGSKLMLNISGSNFGPADTKLDLFKLNLIGAYSNGSVAWTSKKEQSV